MPAVHGFLPALGCLFQSSARSCRCSHSTFLDDSGKSLHEDLFFQHQMVLLYYWSPVGRPKMEWEFFKSNPNPKLTQIFLSRGYSTAFTSWFVPFQCLLIFLRQSSTRKSGYADRTCRKKWMIKRSELKGSGSSANKCNKGTPLPLALVIWFRHNSENKRRSGQFCPAGIDRSIQSWLRSVHLIPFELVPIGFRFQVNFFEGKTWWKFIIQDF